MPYQPPSERFFNAVIEGRLPTAKKLSLDPNVNINWRDSRNRTALFLTCRDGRLESVKFLLSLEGLGLNLQQAQGATPLLVACQNGHSEVVSNLLSQQNIDVNKPQGQRVSPLAIACQRGHLEIFTRLVSDERVQVNAVDECGESPLWTAAIMGNLAMVKQLLVSERNVDVAQVSLRNKRNAAEEARWQGGCAHGVGDGVEKSYELIAALIDSYAANPQATRYQLQRELNLDAESAGAVFALVVFLTDGYLQIQE